MIYILFFESCSLLIFLSCSRNHLTFLYLLPHLKNGYNVYMGEYVRMVDRERQLVLADSVRVTQK